MRIEIAATRRELAAITQSWNSSPDNVQPSDIFFPSKHLRALALDRMLVVGMRGAGKSFWSHALCSQELRTAIANNYPKLNYGRISYVCPLRWDSRAQDQLPQEDSIVNALKDELLPRAMWLTIFLNSLRGQLQQAQIALTMPQGLDWRVKFAWTKSHPELAMQILWDLNQHLESKNESILILTDGLDRITSNLSVSHKCVRGLFQLVLEFLRTKGLRFKAFVREDMERSELFNFPDASKLRNDAVTLDWSREELYALVWKKLGQKSQNFRKLSASSLGASWQEKDGAWMNSALDSPTQETMERVLHVFAKEYMGNDVKKGHSYSWWFKHLSDSHERVSPRTFETSLKNGLDSTAEADATHVLMPKDIHEGVRAASKDRVAELEDDYQWIRLVMETFKTRAVPVEWDTVLKSWSSNRVKQQIENKCTEEGIFVPWEQEDRAVLPHLRDVLKTIGVITLRGDGSKVDIPDIYRVGFGVGKKGGIRLKRR